MIPAGVRWYSPLTARNVIVLDGERVLVLKLPGQGDWPMLYVLVPGA